MTFNKGDIVIGLPQSEFEYKLTNNHTLLKVEDILEYEWGDRTRMLVSVIALDREPFMVDLKTAFIVYEDLFRLATNEDRANFLINML